MLIRNNAICFAEFGGISLRPASTEVVPASLAEHKDFKDAVKNGKITIMPTEGDTEPEAEGSGKPWENLTGSDLIDYVEGLFDLVELKAFEKYTSNDKGTQAAVRKAAKAKVKVIEDKKAEAGA
jgi:hypothetical protein